MRKIRLYGKLAKFVGARVLEADINTAAEAVRFLVANFPGVEEHMNDQYYRVVTHVALSKEELHLATSSKTIKIIPVIQGAGAVGRIILGVLLIAVALFVPVGALLAPALFGLGASLVLGGVAQLLTPVPKVAQGQDSVKDPRRSYNFSGIQQTSRAGTPVPIVYGKTLVGSVVISAGVSSDAPANFTDTQKQFINFQPPVYGIAEWNQPLLATGAPTDDPCLAPPPKCEQEENYIQWFRIDPTVGTPVAIPGANSVEYTVQAEDMGKQLLFRLYNKDCSMTESLITPTVPIAPEAFQYYRVFGWQIPNGVTDWIPMSLGYPYYYLPFGESCNAKVGGRPGNRPWFGGGGLLTTPTCNIGGVVAEIYIAYANPELAGQSVAAILGRWIGSYGPGSPYDTGPAYCFEFSNDGVNPAPGLPRYNDVLTMGPEGVAGILCPEQPVNP